MDNVPLTQEVPLYILHRLPNVHFYPAVASLPDMQRDHLRVDRKPLPCPIILHPLMSFDKTALPAVWPMYLRVHKRDCRIQVSPVKSGISLVYQSLNNIHIESFKTSAGKEPNITPNIKNLPGDSDQKGQ